LALASVALALISPSALLRAQDNAAPPPAAAAPTDTGADTATGPVQDTITFQTFYDNLAPNGTWIQTNDYGYVWQPNVTDPNWAPYTLGHWAYTDDGWTWMSDEPFGWATYHYGRWANLQDVGWVWVPGYVWAPAWVSWRTSEDHVGWAPLPPDSMAGVDYSVPNQPVSTDQGAVDSAPQDTGYAIGSDVDEYYGIGPAYYVFIPIGFFSWHDYRGHWCDRHDNWWLINHTHNVTNTRVSRHGPPGQFHHVTVGGPDLNAVNAKSQTPIQRVTLTNTKSPGNGNLNGNTLSVYAPHVGAGTATGAKPQQVASTLGQLKINRGTEVTQPLAVNSHLAPTLPTQDQIAKARLAQGQVPQGAKVLTDGATFGASPRTPLTTLKPVVSHGSSPVFNAQGGQGQRPGQTFTPQVQNQGQPFTPQVHNIQQNNTLGSPNAATRVYQQVPQVYQSQPPIHEPQQAQVFTPALTHTVIQQPAGGFSGGGAAAGATHVYSQPVNSVPSQPVVRESAPVQSAPAQSSATGSSGGHAASSASSSSASSSSSGGSSNSSSGGGGTVGGPGNRNH
jgi:hypothetical protein